MLTPDQWRAAERRRRLDVMRAAPVAPPPILTPGQQAKRAAWVEKLRAWNRELLTRQHQQEGRAPAEPQTGPTAHPLTITLPDGGGGGPAFHELRQRLMFAAVDILDWQDQTDRGLSAEGFLYEVADRTGFDLQTPADVDAFSPWVKKARAMSTEYRRRAAANDGQYLIW